METAAISADQCACAHCGLPVKHVPPLSSSAEIFCCHACRLVAAIIGKQEQGQHSWDILRLGFGGLLAMNIMMISLLLYTGSIESSAVPVFRRVLLVLSAPALVVLIPPLVSGAARDVRAGRVSLDALIAAGSISAYAVSAVNVVRGAGEVYFDTATMLPVLVTVGKVIEASAKRRAADLLKSLESLLPAAALRVTSAGFEEVGIDDLSPGDRIRVRPGERIAVDGTILEGNSCLEEAAFSGEFLPRHCQAGDSVIAGTVNGTGSLLVLAEKTGSQLLLSGILAMIRDAWHAGSRAERIAQRAATLFFPVVLTVAACSLLWWVLAGDFSKAIISALSVLVVACPCTIGIATPLATSLAVARAAKAGIVVRGGSVMERLAGVEMIFLDKTGTLTAGVPVVHEVVAIDPQLDENELLGRLAALECASGHPLGKAVIERARANGIEEGSACEVQVFPGLGIRGKVTWRGVTKDIAAGAESFVGRDPNSASMEETATIIDVAWDGELRGRLLVGDTIRPDAGPSLARLASEGIALLLLSGDRLAAAMAVAKEVGIGEVYACRTPAVKMEAVSAAVAAGRTVAMVGDGINDAPALAAAGIGIAVAGGMDLAKQAGNVVILSGSLAQIPWLIDLSKQTVKVIRGNFAWSFGYNAIALAAAAAGLLHPLLAALLMVVSSLTVLGNSLRIVGFSGCEGGDAASTQRAPSL